MPGACQSGRDLGQPSTFKEPDQLNDFRLQECIHDLALVVVDCLLTKTDWADVANAVSSRILYEPREGGSRRQRSDCDGIIPHPIFAQSVGVLALRRSRPRAARRCRLQLLLDFCIDLFSDNAVAIRIAETAVTRSSITPSVDHSPHSHAFAPLGPGGIKPMSPARPHRPFQFRDPNVVELRQIPWQTGMNLPFPPASPAFLVAESER